MRKKFYMNEEVQKALNELKNAVWMLVIPLVMGVIALFGSCQWMMQDNEWRERLEDTDGLIYEVEPSECIEPRPEGTGHICAQSTDWWSPIDSTDCEGGQCYELSYLKEMDSSYMPIVVPGLLPLIFLFVVINKIKNARTALNAALDSQKRYGIEEESSEP